MAYGVHLELGSQPLSPGSMAGFSGAVAAWVDGARWPGDPARIPLRRNVQVVVEVGRPLIPPHAHCGFPPGY